MPVTQFLSMHAGGTYCHCNERGNRMSDRKNQQYRGLDRRAPRAPPPSGKPETPANPDAPTNLLKRSEKPGGRHGAITNTLYSWHSYKNWAEKMRGSWDDKK
jgi:hypothetical protein